MNDQTSVPDPWRTTALTVLALTAFAANSVLCRLALGRVAIDAASFSTIRLASGAAMLLGISTVSRSWRLAPQGGNWGSAACLFLYAIAFSLAYLSLSAGTGALILFGAVQATMLIAALRSGERPHPVEWVGLFLAIAGLLYLVSPGLTAPSPRGAGLMALAGISWGFYSLRGRGTKDPLLATTGNFIRTVPFTIAVSLALRADVHLSRNGVVLALVSGAITSGVGYVIWYAALRGLTATRAAVVQLAVPIIAAIAGVIILSEAVSLRLVLAAALVLGGVGLAVASRRVTPSSPR